MPDPALFPVNRSIRDAGLIIAGTGGRRKEENQAPISVVASGVRPVAPEVLQGTHAR